MARDPSEYFRAEAREIVDGLGRGVLAIEKQASAAQVAELFRLAHTLKGAARVVKQAAIAQDAHALEDLLARLRDGGLPPGREDIDQLLAKVDAIAERVRRLEAPAAREVAAAAPSEEAPALGIDSGALDSLSGHLAEATRALAAVESTLESLARIGELQGALAGVRQARGRLREARDDADSLRLVSVSTLFLSLERAARDAGRSLGKQIAFTAGGDIRVEPSLLSALHGPLVQLVRNAVAHGIELPAERTRAGKPLAGAVQVDVGRRGARIEIRLSRRRARRRRGRGSTRGRQPRHRHPCQRQLR